MNGGEPNGRIIIMNNRIDQFNQAVRSIVTLTLVAGLMTYAQQPLLSLRGEHPVKHGRGKNARYTIVEWNAHANQGHLMAAGAVLVAYMAAKRAHEEGEKLGRGVKEWWETEAPKTGPIQYWWNRGVQRLLQGRAPWVPE